MLQDQAVVPLLRERLDLETDPGLQLAYASTLGKLRAVEAAPKIFALLHTSEKRGARVELALALARIPGNENFFIRLARQVRVDPSTPLSQAVVAIRKKHAKHALRNAALPAGWNDCSVAFSRWGFPACRWETPGVGAQYACGGTQARREPGASRMRQLPGRIWGGLPGICPAGAARLVFYPVMHFREVMIRSGGSQNRKQQIPSSIDSMEAKCVLTTLKTSSS